MKCGNDLTTLILDAEIRTLDEQQEKLLCRKGFLVWKRDCCKRNSPHYKEFVAMIENNEKPLERVKKGLVILRGQKI